MLEGMRRKAVGREHDATMGQLTERDKVVAFDPQNSAM